MTSTWQVGGACSPCGPPGVTSLESGLVTGLDYMFGHQSEIGWESLQFQIGNWARNQDCHW